MGIIRRRRKGIAEFLLGMYIIILGVVSSTRATDCGHHFDLTRDALVTLGVPPDRVAIKVVQIQNIYCDLWEQANTVIDRAMEYRWLILPAVIAAKWSLIFFPQEVRELSNRFLHFDDLTNHEEVEREWDRTLVNTYLAVQRARRDNDAIGLLTILGITLHKLQDFYAHSNWSHIDWDGDATWFDVPREVRRSLVHLPAYDIYTTGRIPHDRLHKDNASRLGFDKSYREAFYASVQWAQRIKDWAGTELWNRAMRQSPANTEREHHFARYLCWYAATWKGPGLEEERSRDDMVALSLAYTNFALSALREITFLSKWKEYCRILTDATTSLSLSESLARTLGMVYPERRNWLRLEITKAKQTDNDLVWDIDPGGEADFYTRVTVNGTTYLSGMYEDRDRVEFRSSPTYPSTWVTLVPFSTGTARLRASVQLIDEDCVGGGALPSIRGGDDICDINPALDATSWTGEFAVADLRRLQEIETDGFRYGASWYESDGDGDEAKVAFNVVVNEPPRGGRPPVIRSLTPSSLTLGGYHNVTIRGVNFYPSVRVGFGPGVRVHTYRRVSEEEIQTTIDVPGDAPTGTKSCTVRTNCGFAVSEFRVTPRPPAGITAVVPSSCPQGAGADLIITGEGFFDITDVSLGPGINVLNFQGVRGEDGKIQIHVSIACAAGAPLGPRDVTVSQRSAETGIGRGLFLVTAPPPRQAPRITSVRPPSGDQGDTLELVVKGVNLVKRTVLRGGPLGPITIDSTEVILSPDAGITKRGVRVVANEGTIELRVRIRIDPFAAPGRRNLIVRTPNGSSQTPFEVKVRLD